MGIPEYADMDSFVLMRPEDAKPYFFGLSIILPDNSSYADTHGLDKLDVR